MYSRRECTYWIEVYNKFVNYTYEFNDKTLHTKNDS